jgi:hypothetical protein
MTFTGTKFRLNGYRTPWVAEKIEAGEEGALNGRRLVLGVDGYLSYHMRSLLVSQSKPASDPSQPEPDPNAVTTSPFQSLAWDYTGPITENVGIWTEWYSTQQTTAQGNAFGPVDNDEYDVKMTFNPGDGGNIVGFGINNQPRYSPFFGAFGSGAPGIGQGNQVNVTAYAWLRDRVALSFSVMPGTDDYDYERMAYGANVAFLPMNTDALWLMFTGHLMTGVDMTPLVGGLRGVSAVRPGGGNYTRDDMGDGTRFYLDMRFGALDKGPWSWNTATGVVLNTETYNDGAETKMTTFGTSWRLFYERTYGLLLNFSKYLSYEFTDAAGVTHDVPNDIGFGVGFVYRQAMNFAWELQFNNTQSLTLDQNWRNGWSWVLRWHYLY